MTLSDYMSLFPGATWEKTRFMEMARIILSQVDDLIYLINNGLKWAFCITSAEGINLDNLGAAVGLSRDDIGVSVSDDTFCTYLLAKMALWGWDGTNAAVPDALSVFPGSTETDNRDGTVTVSPRGTLPVPAKELFPVPAGVGITT